MVLFMIAFGWFFAVMGVLIMGIKDPSTLQKSEGITTAKKLGPAKEMVEDAADKELLYEYMVEGKKYNLIVTPGDVVENFINVAYNKENPEEGRIYYKEADNQFSNKIGGLIFVGVGIFVMFMAFVVNGII